VQHGSKFTAAKNLRFSQSRSVHAVPADALQNQILYDSCVRLKSRRSASRLLVNLTDGSRSTQLLTDKAVLKQKSADLC